MKYYVVKFKITPYSSDAADIVAALAGDAGFETFESSDSSLTGYVQQQLFDESLLRHQLTDFPLSDIVVGYTVSEAEDRDWNEQWEQQGFEPIVICGAGSEEQVGSNDLTLVIHDGRHLPQEASTSPLLSVPQRPAIEIEIDARQAFGTGTHETTRMVCAALCRQDLGGRRLLDCGTGTGILAIAALKLGASEAVGYDIDEWSVANARHNAVINRVDESFEVLPGDAAILNKVEGAFDVVTANINRNILMNDMPSFVGKMAAGATLILSGFYTTDTPLLKQRAEHIGLRLVSQEADNNWACLVFRKH